MKKVSLEERFWNKVLKKGHDDCWEWTGSRNWDGYGQINVDGKTRRAHRLSWVMSNRKKIPKNMVIMHTCDNPPCVNPSHLVIGTQAENMADREKKNRGADRSGNKNPMFGKKRTKETRDKISASRKGRYGGEKNPRAILSKENVLKIREMYSTGDYTQKEIAKIFGVADVTISDITRWKTWRIKGS